MAAATGGPRPRSGAEAGRHVDRDQDHDRSRTGHGSDSCVPAEPESCVPAGRGTQASQGSSGFFRISKGSGDQRGGSGPALSPKYLQEAAGLIYSEDDEGHDLTWVNRIWEMLRLLKAHPSLGSLDADDALGQVEATLGEMFPGAADPWFALTSTHEYPLESDEVLGLFLDGWRKIRVPVGAHLLDRAAGAARAEPFITTLPYRRPGVYLKLLNLGIWLALLRGSRFFLSARVAGRTLGCSPMSAQRALRLLVSDGWMKIVRTGRAVPASKARLATEFELALNRWPDDLLARLPEALRTVGDGT